MSFTYATTLPEAMSRATDSVLRYKLNATRHAAQHIELARILSKDVPTFSEGITHHILMARAFNRLAR